MNISPGQVASKKKVGWLNQTPVWAIETIGGLNLMVVVRGGKAEPLAVAPHRAVAKHLARKRCPQIQWAELTKAEDAVDPGSPLVARYAAATDHVRRGLGFRG